MGVLYVFGGIESVSARRRPKQMETMVMRNSGYSSFEVAALGDAE